MIKLRYSDPDCDEAQHYFAVSRGSRRLLNAINQLEESCRLECLKNRDEALDAVGALICLRENHIPLDEVEELAQRTRDSIHTLAQSRADLTERTKETAKRLGDHSLMAQEYAEQLSDCLLGLTNEFKSHLRERVAKKDREMAAEQEREKRRGIFSWLKFWK